MLSRIHYNFYDHSQAQDTDASQFHSKPMLTIREIRRKDLFLLRVCVLTPVLKNTCHMNHISYSSWTRVTSVTSFLSLVIVHRIQWANETLGIMIIRKVKFYAGKTSHKNPHLNKGYLSLQVTTPSMLTKYP